MILLIKIKKNFIYLFTIDHFIKTNNKFYFTMTKSFKFQNLLERIFLFLSISILIQLMCSIKLSNQHELGNNNNNKNNNHFPNEYKLNSAQLSSVGVCFLIKKKFFLTQASRLIILIFKENEQPSRLTLSPEIINFLMRKYSKNPKVLHFLKNIYSFL